MFKAHFFPNYSIMEAKDLRFGSYVWTSILKGRDVIQRCSLENQEWKINNGLVAPLAIDKAPNKD